MAADLFTTVADRLCELSDLDRLEARGTVRLAFKKAGVDVNSFGSNDVEAVFSKIMPAELAARGCDGAEAICDRILKSLEGDMPESATQSSDDIFRRLGDA
jgi:hypothetical protein